MRLSHPTQMMGVAGGELGNRRMNGVDADRAERQGGMGQRRYRAVVADDDEDVRLLARRHLERSERFTVVAEAADGAEAIEAAEEHQPDVTLLDLLMPDTDGLTALPRIRAAAPTTTVVVVSGMRKPSVREDVLAAGAAGFLEKQGSWGQFVDDLLSLLASETGEPPGSGQQRQMHLPNALTSGHEAREFLRETLSEWEAPHLLDDAELLTSELINNAVLHATSAVRLTVLMDTERLRVEVGDTGAGALHLRHVEITADNGRGLFLVDALSRSWGTSAGAEGKIVWFELDTKSS